MVLDLETTGGAPDGGGITEIGAVKVRGGEQLGEFATLVNPGEPIPPFITVLTGITEAMLVAGAADRGGAAGAAGVPAGRGAGRPQRALRRRASSRRPAPGTATPGRSPRVLDTAALARRVLTRDEVPNRKLGTLAALLPRRRPAQPPGARRRPGHRRRAARADRPAGQPQGAHARRRDRVRQGGHPGPAAPSGTWPRGCRTRRGSTSSAAADDRPLYVGTSSRHRDPGAQLLHRRREAGPDRPRCSTRRSGSRRSSAPTRWRPRSASCG